MSATFHEAGSRSYRCLACRNDRHAACLGGRCTCDVAETCGPAGQRPLHTIAGHLARKQEAERRAAPAPDPVPSPVAVAVDERRGSSGPPLVDRIIAVLTGGPLLAVDGRARSVLCDRLEFVGDPHLLSQALARLERAGRIRRDIAGKRCYRIELVDGGLAAVVSIRPELLELAAAVDVAGDVVDEHLGEAAARRAVPIQHRTRSFVLERLVDDSGVSGTGIVAWGAQFPDGTCVVRFCVTGIRQTSVWDSIEHVEAIHGHGGHTLIRWVTP